MINVNDANHEILKQQFCKTVKNNKASENESRFKVYTVKQNSKKVSEITTSHVTCEMRCGINYLILICLSLSSILCHVPESRHATYHNPIYLIQCLLILYL